MTEVKDYRPFSEITSGVVNIGKIDDNLYYIYSSERYPTFQGDLLKKDFIFPLFFKFNNKDSLEYENINKVPSNIIKELTKRLGLKNEYFNTYTVENGKEIISHMLNYKEIITPLFMINNQSFENTVIDTLFKRSAHNTPIQAKIEIKVGMYNNGLYLSKLYSTAPSIEDINPEENLKMVNIEKDKGHFIFEYTLRSINSLIQENSYLMNSLVHEIHDHGMGLNGKKRILTILRIKEN
ncbi:MAG: hypothetical protein IPO92_15645 [Saprospiraceae bacterium]|nr:hypothetical protein [Saprospiraceae bacterium]